ncbi:MULTISPECIES: ribosome silencing factor [Nesterenkonia]|uniref:Ribosomal silencing factor RsfS n=2 Tax=Nesterenkonia TaxID=57494 RepID=A0A0W8IDE8_9MICC|nr:MULTISPECIES: ribosome silencing factor [Nesterenkonia]KUG57971.1 Iojap-like protein [Nesterenkonia jeotgali]MBA8920729.1 ribosome-associated protein [Nesterenkonia jeotgali]NYJ17692.1 ribosome-associated protein [Nesterenkonia sandarakina]
MAITELVLSELRTAASAAADKLATNIVGLDVGERLGITDAFLVCSAPSERQIGAIVDEVERQLKEQHDSSPLRREGRGSGTWVLLDYGHMVVHVQHEEERAVYGLDRLYADVAKVDLQLPAEQ